VNAGQRVVVVEPEMGGGSRPAAAVSRKGCRDPRQISRVAAITDRKEGSTAYAGMVDEGRRSPLGASSGLMYGTKG